MKTSAARASCCCGSKTPCDCPVCTGLECLERPRFFAGQLLTEAELNGAQDYVRAKNRLHNLHLHGWGVVCGLEVVCHECPGWVTVSSGYAIDPCGEDVIVCQSHPLNVAELIRKCKDARRKKRRDDCDPRRPFDPDKPGLVENWCITLRYVEREARPTTALRREGSDSCGCGPGCSCGCPPGDKSGKRGGGGDCGCGCHDKSVAGAQEARHGVGKTVSPCEPTRILESYCLEVCEAPDDYCPGESSAEKAWKGKLQACIDGLRKTLSRLPTTATGTLVDVQLNTLGVESNLRGSSVPPTAVQVHQSYRDVRDFVRELLRRNPGNTHCALLDRLDGLDDPLPTPGVTLDGYRADIEPPSRELLNILVVSLLDCLCWALLPPCAPCCPGEDELVLACLTVRDGKIEHICNTTCRRYAGAFPPTLGGIHLGPIWPLIAKALDVLCCGDLFDRIFSLARGSDAGRSAARFVAGDNFARPRVAVEQLRALSLDGLFGDLLGRPDTEHLNLASLVEQPMAEATVRAKEHGVDLAIREVAEAPAFSFLSALPPARRGDHLVAYTHAGRVVGFARAGSTEEILVAQSRELAELKKEVAALRQLRWTGEPGETGASGS